MSPQEEKTKGKGRVEMEEILATPVIQVWDGIILMPLVGIIDTVRAQILTERLLEKIVETGAEVVILDVDGVPVVDTRVASHIIAAIEAARLLGAQSIMTGISPYNAQTLARLGIDLSGINTQNTLKAGVKRAFKILNLRVVSDN